MAKLDQSGNLIAVWDPGYDDRISEMWRIVFNSCTKQAIIGGGGISGTYQACVLDTTLSNLTPVNVLGTSGIDYFHDFSLLAIDNYSNCFMATCQKGGSPGDAYDNKLLECPANGLLPVNYMVSDNHSFVEVSSIPYVQGFTSETNGYNGIAVNANFLYTYDGNLLQQWNKNAGTVIQSRILGGVTFASGGIDINDCDTVYLGFGNSILKIDPTTLATVSTVQTFTNNIFDLKLGPGNMLYATGRRFIAAISLPNTCGSLNLATAATEDSCASKGTATVTPLGGIGPFTYLWSASAQTTQTITGLTAGSYSVTVTDLAFTPCSRSTGGTQTIAVTVPSSSTGTVAINPPSSVLCNGQFVSLTASGSTSYTWSPSAGLSATTGANISANPTTTTTYTVTGSNIGLCGNVSSITVTVKQPSPVTINPTLPVICNGNFVTLTAGGGATGFVWNPAAGLPAGHVL